MNKDSIFNLSEDELALATSKNTKKNKLIFAVLLKYFQLEGHYPKHIKYIDPLMISCIANQLNVSPSYIDGIDWESRSTKRFRQEIRSLMGYKKANNQDINKLKIWLTKEVFPNAPKKIQQIEYAYHYFRQERIEPFTSKELERHIRSAYKKFEQQLFNSIDRQLSDETKQIIDSLLTTDPANGDNEVKSVNNDEIKFNDLKKDIPGAKLKHVTFAIQKVHFLKQINLPETVLSALTVKLIKKYYMRVMAELVGRPVSHLSWPPVATHRAQLRQWAPDQSIR